MTEKTKGTLAKNPPAEAESGVFVKPHYRVKSEEHAFELRVVMPGVGKNDVDIALEDSRLRITGRPHREVPREWRPLHEELLKSPYRLELQLHRDIDESGIAAKVEDGILTLKLPLKEAAKPREIAVH